MKEDITESRVHKRLQREIENLHGNESLTSDLDDSSAKMFLSWAEKRIRSIVDSTLDLDDADAEEAMYPRLKAMRRMARTINQIVRGGGEPTELVDKIVGQARNLYGTEFREPDRDKIQDLLSMPPVKPEALILDLQQLFEGEEYGQEDQPQQ